MPKRLYNLLNLIIGFFSPFIVEVLFGGPWVLKKYTGNQSNAMVPGGGEQSRKANLQLLL